MKVIFLDVDGELTYCNYENEETDNIDVEKVKIVKEICDATNAKVVISSSWRGNEKHRHPRIYRTLIKILTENGVEVVGDCPMIPCEVEGDIPPNISLTTLEDLPFLKIKHGTGRAAEVEAYIKEHNVKKFVILDDEDYQWEDYGFGPHWIQPTWFGDGGLQPEHVKQAIEILGKREK